MTLADYLADQQLDDAAFASTINVDRSSVNRMRRSKLIPKADVLRRIVKVTKGAVTPNDFFGIGEAAGHDAGDALAALSAPSGMAGELAGSVERAA